MITIGYVVWRWISVFGGPTALSKRIGAWAPAISIPAHIVLSATPFPSELFGVTNGSIYGLFVGTIYSWIGWWCGAMVEYSLLRRGAQQTNTDAIEGRLPKWVRRFPIDHPAFLISGRFAPFGFHTVNVLAATAGVSPRHQMITAAISNLIYAFATAAVGAGLIAIGWPGG